MSTLVLPYREEGWYDSPAGVVPILQPTIDVTVRLGDAAWSVRALVDPSNPATIFDRGTADALGIEFVDDEERVELHRLAGRDWVAQVETVTLAIDGLGAWDADVAFLKDEWLNGPNMRFAGVLGTRGFLDRYVVSFDGRTHRVVIDPA